jgi:hypothetical protein
MENLRHSKADRIQSQEASPAAPNKADQVVLVKQSMKDFAVAINNKNMEGFRKTISQLWQKQVTTEQLNKVFAPFIENDIDLTALDPLEPSLDNEAKIDENGVLTIVGRYPTKPSQVTFEQKYIYEGTSWKLVGLNVNIKKAT